MNRSISRKHEEGQLEVRIKWSLDQLRQGLASFASLESATANSQAVVCNTDFSAAHASTPTHAHSRDQCNPSFEMVDSTGEIITQQLLLSRRR